MTHSPTQLIMNVYHGPKLGISRGLGRLLFGRKDFHVKRKTVMVRHCHLLKWWGVGPRTRAEDEVSRFR